MEKYKCFKCGTEFEDGIPARHCPRCYSVYVEWISFKTDWHFDEKEGRYIKNG